jgi:uncharacterized protein
MKTLTLIILAFILNVTSFAQNVLPKPVPARFVVDKTNTLSVSERQLLEKKIKEINKTGNSQIAVVLISGLGEETIEDYATALFNKWGIGDKEQNNGVLILAAMKDRKIRIEVGTGLEKKVTNAIATSIIENDITPAFRTKNYFDGLYTAIINLDKASVQSFESTDTGASANTNTSEGKTAGINPAPEEGLGTGFWIAIGVIFGGIALIITVIVRGVKGMKRGYSQSGANVYNNYGGGFWGWWNRRRSYNEYHNTYNNYYRGPGSSSYNNDTDNNSGNFDSISSDSSSDRGSDYGGGSSSGSGATGSW